MSHLHILQSEFAQALFSETEQGLQPTRLYDSILDNGLDAQRRVNIYKNNLIISLTSALHAIYPVIQTLVGEDFFAYASKQYIEQHPSQSGNLHTFGEYFSKFLSHFSPAKELVYLPDIANLEWAYHLAFHANDEQTIDIAALTKLDNNQLSHINFQLNDSAHLIESEYPILRIWEANQESYTGDNVNLNEGGVKLIVNRNRFDIEFTTLRNAEYAFLQSLMNDQSFTLACDSAVHYEQNINLSECLHKFITSHIIVNFTLL